MKQTSWMVGRIPRLAGCVLWLTLLFSSPAAADTLCDSAFQDCRAHLVSLIRNEQVGIDVAFWFMKDQTYTTELIQRFRAGVRVRVLMDTDANTQENPENAVRLEELRSAGIPMRERVGSGILHWKTMIFAGQNIVEFSAANYSSSAFAYSAPYTDYVAEAIYFTDKASVVNSFKTRFDDLWADTSRFQNYANVKTLARVHGRYPKDPELNFPPTESYADRAIPLYNQEMQRIDVIMYRITDQRHANAMISAVRRGVPVRLLTEPEQYRDPTRLWHSWNVDRLYMAGVQIKHRRHAGLNHQKSVLLYGQRMTIFGSSNWTSPSDQSQEEHNYFTTDPNFFTWFVNQFARKWNGGAGVVEYEDFVPLPPPEGPRSPTPASGSTNIGRSGVTLRWFGGPFAHLYDVYFGVTPDPPLVAQNLELGPSLDDSTFQSYTISTTLQPGTTYYWRVVSKTMANQGAWSQVWSFTTEGGTGGGGWTPGGVGPQPTTAPVAGMAPGSIYSLLWRHDALGALAMWQMNGITLVGASAPTISQMTDANWKVAGMGDLNGDGQQDVVWQNDATGALAAWYLRGSQVTLTASLSISGVSDTAWKVRGVGDTNGDQLADLVWQNTSDGRLAIWQMNGTRVIRTSTLSMRVSDTAWKVRAVGDANGDGRDDLFWQNSTTGELGVWFLNGSTVIGTARLSIGAMRDTNWRIVGAQDVNGDRRADILWQHSSGSIATWFLQGQTVIATYMFNPSEITDPGWKLVGPR